MNQELLDKVVQCANEKGAGIQKYYKSPRNIVHVYFENGEHQTHGSYNCFFEDIFFRFNCRRNFEQNVINIYKPKIYDLTLSIDKKIDTLKDVTTQILSILIDENGYFHFSYSDRRRLEQLLHSHDYLVIADIKKEVIKKIDEMYYKIIYESSKPVSNYHLKETVQNIKDFFTYF